MRKFAPVLLFALLASGCIDKAYLVTVNQDGSALIHVREYFSPQVTSMLEGMGGLVGDLGGIAGEEMPNLDIEEFLKEQIDANTTRFGPGTVLENSRVGTNTNGWKGYVASYRVPQIDGVTVSFGDPEASADMGAGSGMDSTSYRFEFTPGDEASLKVVPADASSAEGEAAAEAGAADASVDSGLEGMESMMQPMLAQMGTMLEGMRMALLVKVDGEIVDTNARYRPEGQDNVIQVMDLKFDHLLKSPEAMSAVASSGKDAFRKLEAMNIPGVVLENPEKTVEITFR